MKQRRLRAPSPAFVISLIALFVALGGTTAYASGLISGRQIVDHSISAKKLSPAAVNALQGPRGPRAISVNEQGITPDSVVHRLITTHRIDVSYRCDINAYRIHFYLKSHRGLGVALPGGHGATVSGDIVQDGVPKSVFEYTTDWHTDTVNGFTAHHTLQLDVVAIAGYGDGMVSRIDLAGSNRGDSCEVWGLIAPAFGSWRRR